MGQLNSQGMKLSGRIELDFYHRSAILSVRSLFLEEEPVSGQAPARVVGSGLSPLPTPLATSAGGCFSLSLHGVVVVRCGDHHTLPSES